MKSTIEALEALFAFPLVRGLLDQSVTTIWAEQQDDGNHIKVRNVPKGPVAPASSADFGSLVAAIRQVLSGRDSLDVTVNQVNVMITRVDVVGGTDCWVMTTAKASGAAVFQPVLTVTI